MNELAESQEDQYKYWAFISYSSKDQRWGRWLIKSIENYRVPGGLVGLKTDCGSVPKRLYPVFRDRDELRVGKSVHEELSNALKQSRYLIVICSPNSANPESWVNTEVADFKAMGREHNVIALIVQGEPFASNRAGGEADECFPVALRYNVSADGQITGEKAEPLAADVTREDKNPRTSRRKALLKIIARMIDVDFDTLEQRDRRRRRQKNATWSVIGLSVVLAFSALFINWLNTNLISTSQKLAKLARENSVVNKDLGALLAVHAYQLHYTPAAYDALLTVVSENPNFITYIHHGTHITSTVLSDDNSLIAVADCPNMACAYQEIHIYNVSTRQHVVQPIRINTSKVSKLAFHPDSNLLYAVLNGDKIHELQKYSFRQSPSQGENVYRTNIPIENFAMSSDGRYYTVVMKGGEYKVFDQLKGGRKCGNFVRSKKINVVFSPDNRWLAISSEGERNIDLVNIATCTENKIPVMDRLSVFAFESDGKTFTTMMPDGTVDEWDLETNTRSRRYNTDYSRNSYEHTFSPRGDLVASIHDNDILIVNHARYRELTLQRSDRSLSREEIAEIDKDMEKTQIARLQGHSSPPSDLYFSKDGKNLVSIDNSKNVMVWSIAAMRLDEYLGDNESGTKGDSENPKASSVDGKYYVTVKDKTEECGGETIQKCKRWLVLSLFDASTDTHIKTLLSDYGPISDWSPLWAKFTKEGKVLAGRDELKLLWHIDPPFLIKQACRIANRSLTDTESEEFLGWRKWLLSKKSFSICQPGN